LKSRGVSGKPSGGESPQILDSIRLRAVVISNIDAALCAPPKRSFGHVLIKRMGECPRKIKLCLTPPAHRSAQLATLQLAPRAPRHTAEIVQPIEDA
jgi:hypothetical protein